MGLGGTLAASLGSIAFQGIMVLRVRLAMSSVELRRDLTDPFGWEPFFRFSSNVSGRSALGQGPDWMVEGLILRSMIQHSSRG